MIQGYHTSNVRRLDMSIQGEFEDPASVLLIFPPALRSSWSLASSRLDAVFGPLDRLTP